MNYAVNNARGREQVGDRIEDCFAAIAQVRLWHKADISLLSLNAQCPLLG
jgi:hypothetical protein